MCSLVRFFRTPSPNLTAIPLSRTTRALKLISIFFDEEGHHESVNWVRGRRLDGSLNFHFTKTPFHGIVGEGWEWAPVIEFNTVNSTSFIVTSLNGTFSEATATIAASSRNTAGSKRSTELDNAVGTVTFKN